jgi:hypothetical protein
LIVANWTGFDQNFRLTGGVVVSEDGGRNWEARNHGLLPGYSPGNASGSIAFDPFRADTSIWRPTEAGIYRVEECTGHAMVAGTGSRSVID